MSDEILNASDSKELYEPSDFDYQFEFDRAEKLAKKIARRTALRAEVDEPSGFQDGALFTRILLFSPQGGLPGQVLISSFGSLVTVYQMADDAIVGHVSSVATECGYSFVDGDKLSVGYDGKFKNFIGMTWFERFFCAFYVRPQML